MPRFTKSVNKEIEKSFDVHNVLLSTAVSRQRC